jgi:cytochrome c peroxidase
MSRAEVYRQVRAMSAIGRRMFSDPKLSGSGHLSCASCHSPSHAYGPPNALSVQPGGANVETFGLRAVPSLTYKQITPQFAEHFHESDEDGDESVDAGPTGGLTWDGRVDRGRDQALLPLLSPLEMANRDRAALAIVIEANYGQALREALPGVPAGADGALEAALRAIEAFEEDYVEFFPYTSKYDAVLAGSATLSAQEARGLALFDDPAKGNCAHCHPSARNGSGAPPQFTDYGLVALGVPRNRDVPANRDPNFFDLGLCGPVRLDLRDRPEYCGMFKAPTLRNVARRKAFFHNGIFHDLRDVLEFYVQRDIHPEKWYPRNADGSVRKFDDLPGQYHQNVNLEPPFDRKPGEAPALSDSEIDDVIAFLHTLTDGYRPR